MHAYKTKFNIVQLGDFRRSCHEQISLRTGSTDRLARGAVQVAAAVRKKENGKPDRRL